MSFLKKTLSGLKVLLIEPDASLVSKSHPVAPYTSLFQQNPEVTHVESVELALSKLLQFSPDVVFLSMSFSPQKTIQFLEVLKDHSQQKLTPVVFVINLSHALSTVPGTTWGNALGILHTTASQQEFEAVLNRVL